MSRVVWTVGRRIVGAVLVIWGVLTIVFLLTHLSGDPTPLFVPVGATHGTIAHLRHELGFDRSLPAQYLDFLGTVVGDGFGTSLIYRQNALGLVLARMPATLSVAGLALLITVVVSIPLGMLAALKRERVADGAIAGAAVAGLAMPSFWVGTILILIFAVNLRIFPTSGNPGPSALVLPAVTLAVNGMGMVVRMMRASTLEELSLDYVRTARAKGLPRSTVYFKHVLRNGLIPVVTVVGLQIPVLLGGAIITETVFGFPGMGRLATQAVLNRDFPVVQAFVFVTAVLVLVANLLVDAVYAVIDPRVRDAYRGRR